MKMGSGLFWGILLVVLGASLIFKVVFNINLPIFRIIIAFILIYLGFRILFGNFSNKNSETDTIFSETHVHPKNPNNKEYNVIFGQSKYDLTDIEFKDGQPMAVEFNAVFGSSRIRVNRNIPLKIKGATVFAKLDFPNGSSTFFGETTYLSDNFNENEPYLYIEASAVFGNIEINTY